jgi:hypothetical protein
MVLGQETPKIRIGTRPRAGAAGLFENTVGGVIGPDAGGDRSGVVADGWNIVSNMSQVTPQFIGDPDSTQLVGYRLQEQIIEQFHKKPAGRAQSPRGPTTPG